MAPAVTLRPCLPADWELVQAILRDPGVAPWWGEVGDSLADELAEPYLVLADGEAAGVLDVVEEPEPDYRHAALDIVLRERFQNRGIGRTALRAAIEMLVSERGHHRFTIDPAAVNERAIRCYEAVGFRRVGVLREYERGPDGRWRDGLLLDLLAADLR